jgi:hypothetical protein
MIGQVWDHDRYSNNDLIGQARCSLGVLQSGTETKKEPNIAHHRSVCCLLEATCEGFCCTCICQKSPTTHMKAQYIKIKGGLRTLALPRYAKKSAISPIKEPYITGKETCSPLAAPGMRLDLAIEEKEGGTTREARKGRGTLVLDVCRIAMRYFKTSSKANASMCRYYAGAMR